MTDDELAVIERDHARIAAGVPSIWPDAVALAYIPLLLAEIRRQRALLTALVEIAPIQYRDGDNPHCAYCEAVLSWLDRPGHGIHAGDCPWVAARDALAPPAPPPDRPEREETG